MLNLPSSVRILYCVVPVDMRRSFDSLAEIVRSALGEEPMSGHLFVFRNKNEDSVKVLYWDRDGYAIWYKRLEKGKFALPRGTSAGVQIDSTTFSMLLHGVDLKAAHRQARYAAPVTA
jgi:transposase